MAVKIVEDSAVLTLDFWDKETIYNGQVFPVGTLACDALNIPTEVVSHMEKLCEKLNGFMKTFDSGKGDPALLPEAKFSAMKLLELMAKYKPFSYISLFTGLHIAFGHDTVSWRKDFSFRLLESFQLFQFHFHLVIGNLTNLGRIAGTGWKICGADSTAIRGFRGF